MTNGAKTPVASRGQPRANSAACDRTEALSSTARQRPAAGSLSPHDVSALLPASDRAPGSEVADRLARLETLDLSAMGLRKRGYDVRLMRGDRETAAAYRVMAPATMASR
jgi:hypothetical protein